MTTMPYPYDSIYGTNTNDQLFGGDKQDALYGKAGNDTLYGFLNSDLLNGETGHDWLYGGAGNDGLDGGAGDDRLYGEAGNDGLWGGAGRDWLYGGAGNDELHGWLGRDVLVGGKGADAFIFTSTLGQKNVDTIKDFSRAEGDKIKLWEEIFHLEMNPTEYFSINPNAFHIGKKAHDADDRIIYNQATGALYWDQDGNGAAAAVKFAQLKAGTSLRVSDFEVY